MGGDREAGDVLGPAGQRDFQRQSGATVFGITLWFGALFALRLMAKADRSCDTYLRHRQYKAVLPGSQHALP